MKKWLKTVLSCVLCVLLMTAAAPLAFAEGDPTGDTVYVDVNATNGTVSWRSFNRYGNDWELSASSYIQNFNLDDGFYVEFSSQDIYEAGTYTLGLINANFYYFSCSLDTTIFFWDGSFTITVDGYMVTLSGTFIGNDGKTYVVTVTNSDGSGDTIEINLDTDNAAVDLEINEWEETEYSSAYGSANITAENDDYSVALEIQDYLAQTPGTYTYPAYTIGSCSVCDRQAYGQPTVYLNAESLTVTVDEDIVITVCGTFLGSNGKTYALTITSGSQIPEENPTNYTLTLYPDIGSFAEGSVCTTYPGDGCSVLYIEQPQDTVLTLPTASDMIAEGYSFDGWFTWDQITSHQTDTGTTTYTFTEDGTLYAHWTPNTYTVTVDPNGGYRTAYTSSSDPFQNYNAYTVSTVYGYWLRLFGNGGTIQRDGYRLVGFTGADGGPVAGSFVEPNANSTYFTDPNEYYYYIGPTDETLIAQWEKIPEDKISVTIGDQIGVNLLLDLNARSDVGSVTVVYKDLNGDEQRETFTDFASLPQVEGGLYKIRVDIAPAQIADTVTVYIDGETLSASVKNYCNTLAEGGYGAEIAALAQAVLDYGQTANNFFDYTDETISAVTNLSADDAKAWTPVFADTTGKIRSISFMALTKPEFRFYTRDITEAEAAAYNTAGVTAAYADTSITETLNARFVKNQSGDILIEVTGVMAEYMDETIVVTIDDLGTITFAGNDFAKLMANNAATEALGAALYAYGAAAKACFRPEVDTVDDGMEVPVPVPDGNTP